MFDNEAHIGLLETGKGAPLSTRGEGWDFENSIVIKRFLVYILKIYKMGSVFGAWLR